MEQNIAQTKMDNNVIEISSAYRNSRRNTSILSGIGIAWSAAQFEIKTMSLGTLGGVNIETASIPIIVGVLCIYTMTRCTLEYMMQTKDVRRWQLAQIDYRITLYLVRFTIVVLTAATVARTGDLVVYLGSASLLAAIGFVALTFAFMFVTMPFRLFVRRLSGRTSVASAAIEATFYSFLLSGLLYVIIIVLLAFNIINPFLYLGDNFKLFTGLQLSIFSGVLLVILLSFFFDSKFLNMVFAFEPRTIERKYYEDGKEVISIEANPNHPEYLEIKENHTVVKITKVDSEDELNSV